MLLGLGLLIGVGNALQAQTQPAPAPGSATAPGTTQTAPVQPGPQPMPAVQPPGQVAQPQPAADTAPPVLGVDSEGFYKLKDMFMFSPIINGIIAGLSVIGLMFFLYFLLTINSRAVAPAGFVNEVTNLVLVHRYDAAADLCRRSKGVFIAPIVQRCLENAGKSQSVILDMIDSEGRRLSDVIWNRISYLADISNVAPMLGLLGTVMGMITAFFGLDKESASINASVLSQGVGQAMATTMFGLMVGIGALVAYSIVKSRATKTLAEAESAVHSIADRIRSSERGEDDDTEKTVMDEPSKVF
jgi:biopolymer transport protein ExbB